MFIGKGDEEAESQKRQPEPRNRNINSMKEINKMFIAAKVIEEGWKQPQTLEELAGLFGAMAILCEGTNTELFERFVDKFWQNFNR